jgi:hypothetical protein
MNETAHAVACGKEPAALRREAARLTESEVPWLENGSATPPQDQEHTDEGDAHQSAAAPHDRHEPAQFRGEDTARLQRLRLISAFNLAGAEIGADHDSNRTDTVGSGIKRNSRPGDTLRAIRRDSDLSGRDGAVLDPAGYPAFALVPTDLPCTGEDFRAPGPGCACTAFADSGSPHCEQTITGSNMCPQFLCWCSMGRPRESGMWVSPQCTIAMIIRSSFNVYPVELEAVISSHPAVVQSGVVGRQVAGNEEVVAFVHLLKGSNVTVADVMTHVARNSPPTDQADALTLAPSI